MEKPHNIVYITTNLINGKQYVGDHSTFNLDDSYLGSGNLICKAIKKYGVENFKRVILENCDTKELAFLQQEKYIIEHLTLVPNGYDISPKGGMGISGCWTEESKSKMKASLSKVLKGRVRTQKHSDNISKGRIEKESSKGENNPMFNKTLYDSWVIKYGVIEADSRLATMKAKMSKTREGMVRSEISRKKSHDKMVGQKRKTHVCLYCGKEIGDGNYERWHGDNCKLKPEYIN